MKNKIDYITYLKLFLGMMLIFPLEVAYWSYDFTLEKALVITSCWHLTYFVFGVMMLNYLEEGNPFRLIRKI